MGAKAVVCTYTVNPRANIDLKHLKFCFKGLFYITLFCDLNENGFASRLHLVDKVIHELTIQHVLALNVFSILFVNSSELEQYNVLQRIVLPQNVDIIGHVSLDAIIQIPSRNLTKQTIPWASHI